MNFSRVNWEHDITDGKYSRKKDENDKFLGNVLLFKDLTEVRALRRQVAHSQRLASVGRLAAGVAHEINNPLTAVLTNSSYLLKRTQGSPETREDLQVIVSETIRCREIV